ncbi:hypothetical protein, partial [Bradyrhizobium sp. LjRoot220]|uniref:hypothetical protein n=1 Tax=Bradyrhizobium sp. LjRoot220 TaxID=3342284 RepID=UPI003F50B35C
MPRDAAEGSNPSCQVRQNSPTGKSLPIYGNHVKPKIVDNKKYFAFTEIKIGLYLRPSRPARGAYHDRHDRWDGSRWTLVVPITNGTRAYGKSVWSRRRGAGVNAPGSNS